MGSDGSSGFWLRALRALKRGMLGKSSPEVLEHLTGSSRYWERALGARSGWPRTGPLEPNVGSLPDQKPL
jgi:hypothetical protein